MNNICEDVLPRGAVTARRKLPRHAASIVRADVETSTRPSV